MTKQAQKDLGKCPDYFVSKFKSWVALVEFKGIEAVRLVKGFHDEPLHGKRAGQRSIRLNQAYRAIYIVYSNGRVECAEVQEVHKHEY